MRDKTADLLTWFAEFRLHRTKFTFLDIMQKSMRELKTGWSLKQAGDVSNECWIPVKKVPSQVHIDLIANKK